MSSICLRSIGSCYSFTRSLKTFESSPPPALHFLKSCQVKHSEVTVMLQVARPLRSQLETGESIFLSIQCINSLNK